jgi:hypothetical protein
MSWFSLIDILSSTRLEKRDVDNAPGTTVLLSLPTSSPMLRRISFLINSVLLFMAMDFVTKVCSLANRRSQTYRPLQPHFAPANDLTFARVGAVDSTSAKIIVRYPAAPEPTTTTTSSPAPTPSIIEAIQDVVDGILPEVTLPPKIEEMLTPAPTPRTTSLRVQWRKAVFDTGSLDSMWTDGPVLEMSESRDWVGMGKLTGLQASTEYECESSVILVYGRVSYLLRYLRPTDRARWHPLVVRIKAVVIPHHS